MRTGIYLRVNDELLQWLDEVSAIERRKRTNMIECLLEAAKILHERADTETGVPLLYPPATPATQVLREKS